MRKLKLRHQIIMIIAFAVSIMVIIQGFYYYKFVTVTKQRASAFVNSFFNQLENKLAANFSDINRAAYTAVSDKQVRDFLNANTYEDKYKNYEKTVNVLSYIASSNENIADIVVIKQGNKVNLQTNYSGSPIDYDALLGEMSAETDVFSSSPRFYEVNTNYYAYFLPLFTVQKDNTKQKDMVCIVLCNSSKLKKMVESFNMQGVALLLITDSNNMVVTGSGEKYSEQLFKKGSLVTQTELDSMLKHMFQYKNVIISYRDIQQTGWRISCVIDVNALVADMQEIKISGIYMGIAAFFIMLVIGVIFTFNINRPLKKLACYMEDVAKNGLKQRIALNESNEIGQIGQHINSLMDEIENMTGKILTTQSQLYEAEIEKTRAKLSALQSQINPHFLYNTLECIRGMSLENGLMDIVKISSAMAKIFRYSIKESDYVTVSEEVNCIKDYMSIIQIRYQNRIRGVFDIEDRIMELVIPKMILQPIVENAVYHGLEAKYGNGTVNTKGWLSNDSFIVFEITDDGKGMSKEEVSYISAQLQRGKELAENNVGENRGIGLLNIDRRIKLIYGSEFGISLESREKEGTNVTIRLPVIKSENNLYGEKPK